MTATGDSMSVLWSLRARKDLRSIGDFIARDKPDAAALWVDGILDAAQRAAVFPGAGRVVPEVGRDDIREVILRTYRIGYQVREDLIVILTVFDGHRLLSKVVIDDERNGRSR